MRRIPELDALRGLAAVVIVVYHLWFPDYGILGTAVDLFFVMSGYLITTIILERREQPGFLVTFYARRSLRIWPIYYLGLFFLLAINPALPKPYPTDALPYFLTYTQNLPQYWRATNPPFIHGFYHTWTLAIEEQFYLFWPLALLLIGKRSLVPLAMGLIALAIGTRMAGFSKWILMTRLDGLALGGILAAMLRPDEAGRTPIPTATVRRCLIALGIGSVIYQIKGHLLVLALASQWPDLGDPAIATSLRVFANNLMYFSLIGLVVLRSGQRRLSWLRDARLVELGQMSYGIYLYHYILFDLVQDCADRLGVSNRVILDGIKFTLSFAVAAASWRLIERPLLSLKDRFGYKGRAASTAPRRPELARLESLRPGVQ